MSLWMDCEPDIKYDPELIVVYEPWIMVDGKRISLGFFSKWGDMSKVREALALEQLGGYEVHRLIESKSGKLFKVTGSEPIDGVYQTSEEFIGTQRKSALEKLTALERMILENNGLAETTPNTTPSNT